MRTFVKFVGALAVAAVLGVGVAGVRGEVSLPAVLGSNMVLQREQAVPVWGWAKAGEKVTVTFNEQTVAATAGEDGKWQVKLAAMKAGGPFEMTVAGENTIKLTNVMVGEVWLCSGQSNMHFATSWARNSKEELANAKDLNIRFFQVPSRGKRDVQKDVQAKWQLCDSGSAGGFSAVGFFFGRHVTSELKVPVGMINASMDASPIQGWMPAEAWQVDVRLAGEYAKAHADPKDPDNMWKPATSHNAMIAPLIPYGIRGMLWYQGESNAGGDKLYRIRFDGMVGAWRKMWGQGDFPMLYVQLPNFKAESAFWVDFQELQAMSLQSLPNSGMAVTLDIGENNNIHPGNKQEVSRRLWLNAAAKVYGMKEVEYSGPVFDAMKVNGKTATLSFTHVAGGLVAKGSEDGKTLKGFVIAGEDGKFVPATATIEGDTVVVQGEGVEKPTAVRYAWDRTPTCNLYNKVGLPSGCFRTDSSGPSVMPTGRPGLVPVGVPYGKAAITVDGDGADWKDIAAMPMPFMKKDAGSVKLCWREEGLYGLVTAKEEKITVNAKMPWAGDCFELFIEKDAAGRGERSDATAQYIFAPDAKEQEGAGFQLVAFGSDADKRAKMQVQWKKAPDGYVLEFYIPAEALKPATMAAGTKVGCNFVRSAAGKPVETFYADKNVNDAWGVPAAWGLLKLEK